MMLFSLSLSEGDGEIARRADQESRTPYENAKCLRARPVQKIVDSHSRQH
jgi:hypothetical protein